MAFDITVGSPQLAISDGWSVLIGEPDGAMGREANGPRDRGLYWRDTRLVSLWSMRANGKPWELLNSAATSHFGAQIFMTNRAIPLADGGGDVPPHTLGLSVGRLIGAGGMHEGIDITNHGPAPVRFKLGLHLESDFADIFDVKSDRLVVRGTIATTWQPDPFRLTTCYCNGAFRRGLSIVPKRCAKQPSYADGWLLFDVALERGGRWHTCLEYGWLDGEKQLDAPHGCAVDSERSEQARSLLVWQGQAARLTTSHQGFPNLYRQAVDDLAALRLPLENTSATHFIPAAGIPWFAALFGRDSLITAAQTMPVYPDFACGALDVLGRWQATETDDGRDMQPGKIMHELRQGELAHLKLNPFHPYYGSADATLLYPILLHMAWSFTGGRDLLDRHIEVARRCLDWAERYGDRDGDGFQEYERRAPEGAENQSWKDAGNAIVDEGGEQVRGPKAMCELQGYLYKALCRVAAIEDVLGRPAEARHLRDKAGELYDRFNTVFWSESAGAYALCLDGDKRPVMTNASNQGHLLWSGIVAPERAESVARRLLGPDMWSGWGVRTLSAENPAYNPFDYQNGAVWPHDNGMIAIGLKQYGFADKAAQVARGIVEAGDHFLHHRIPEVFSGIGRDQARFPVQYLGANVPQAWAAGSIFSMLEALIGAEPHSADGIFYVDPLLPNWLPELELSNLRIGPETVTLRVCRQEDGSSRAELIGSNRLRLMERRLGVGLAETQARPVPLKEQPTVFGA